MPVGSLGRCPVGECVTKHREPRDAEPGLVWCSGCLGRFRRDLEDIARLWPDLPGMATSSASDGTVVRSVPGSRPPLRLDVVDMVWPRTSEVVGPVLELANWVRGCRRLSTEVVDVAQAARLVLIHADWVAGQYEAPEMAGNVATAARALRGLMGEAKPRPVGRCPQEGPEGPCGGALRWAGGLSVKCQRCGVLWPEEDLFRFARTAEVFLPTADVARLAGVPVSTLTYWCRSGRVRREGRNRVCLSDAYREVADAG